MKLEALQHGRRKAVGAAALKALQAVKAQSAPLARALREWSRSTKAINAALKRYAKATEGVENLIPPSELDAGDFGRCLRACTTDNRGALTELLSELSLQRAYIERAGKKAARRRVKREKRRASSPAGVSSRARTVVVLK